MILKSFLHLALFVGSLSVVNSKSNSGSNQSNSNSTKGIIRHQQTFETRLNHLVVDNIGGRVSSRSFPRRSFTATEGEVKQSNVRGVNFRGLPTVASREVKSNLCCCFWRLRRRAEDLIEKNNKEFLRKHLSEDVNNLTVIVVAFC